jgi:hypothetical protein
MSNPSPIASENDKHHFARCLAVRRHHDRDGRDHWLRHLHQSYRSRALHSPDSRRLGVRWIYCPGGAFIYAELSSQTSPAAASVYLREAFHPSLAFIYGWTLLLVIQTGGMAAWRLLCHLMKRWPGE